jgi:nitric oxide reductase large subunit
MFQCHLVSLFTRGDYQEEHESQTVMQFSCNVEAQVYNSHQITISESSKRTMVEQSSSDAGTLHNLQAFMAETSWTARVLLTPICLIDFGNYVALSTLGNRLSS